MLFLCLLHYVITRIYIIFTYSPYQGLRDGSVVESTYCSCRRYEFLSRKHFGQMTTACNSTSMTPTTAILKMCLILLLQIYIKLKNKNVSKNQTSHQCRGDEYDHASYFWEAPPRLSFCHYLPITQEKPEFDSYVPCPALLLTLCM